MENWLLDLIAYPLIALALVYPLLKYLVFFDLLDRFKRLTDAPPPPPKPKTPEQIAAEKANLAKLTAMTLEYDRARARAKASESA